MIGDASFRKMVGSCRPAEWLSGVASPETGLPVLIHPEPTGQRIGKTALCREQRGASGALRCGEWSSKPGRTRPEGLGPTAWRLSG